MKDWHAFLIAGSICLIGGKILIAITFFIA